MKYPDVLKTLLTLYGPEQAAIALQYRPTVHFPGLLICAVNVNEPNSVSLLLRCGFDVNEVDHHGTPPLASASGKGFYSISQILFENGADLLQMVCHDFRRTSGNSCLRARARAHIHTLLPGTPNITICTASRESIVYILSYRMQVGKLPHIGHFVWGTSLWATGSCSKVCWGSCSVFYPQITSAAFINEMLRPNPQCYAVWPQGEKQRLRYWTTVADHRCIGASKCQVSQVQWLRH